MHRRFLPFFFVSRPRPLACSLVVPLSPQKKKKNLSFQKNLFHSVGELHAALEAATGVPRSDHILLYRGSPLDDRGTLGAHGLPPPSPRREEEGGGRGGGGGGGGERRSFGGAEDV